MVVHVRVIVSSCHLDHGLTSLGQQCFICCKGTYDHTRDSIEDFLFPVVIVLTHFFRVLSVSPEGRLFDRLQVDVTYVLIVFDQAAQDFLAV